MGKTPKKAAPGGDERNLYNRRLKATTAPSNPSETSLHKRQRESEISNRSKLSTLQKKVPPGQRKNFKSKLRVQTKLELGQYTKEIDRPPGSSKEQKLIIPDKSEESRHLEAMQPESEEAEVKLNPTVQKENIKEDVPADKQESVKECVDHAPSEVALKEQEDSTNNEIIVEEEQTECHKNVISPNESRSSESHEESDLTLSYQMEDRSVKVQEEKLNDKDTKDENKEECSASEVTKSNIPEKEDLQSESQTDTESYSVDVLESTTSEISEVSEVASQNYVQKEKENPEKDMSKDVSFVSYDPSIILKDVQIKLNDCLKENSKLYDRSSVEHSSPIQPSQDMSFGKTLRSISGRRSLSRMRHVTLREYRRYSPSDSMFVNTSSASLLPEETTDFKILRYSTGLPDTLSATNGSPTDRKRKHEIENWNYAKKQKTESEQSLLNSSIGLLKGLRRPIQVSTPVSEMKFQSNKLDLADDEHKPTNEGTKKWCAIM